MHLGLDLGTSGLKALIMDDQQQVMAVKTVPLAVSRPHSGWSEQHPADWIEACIGVFDHPEIICHMFNPLVSLVICMGLSCSMRAVRVRAVVERRARN